jgi:L-ribulokinase
MTKRTLTLGLDYGTETARALLVDTKTGEEIATAVSTYPNGVIESELPDGTRLEPETALQDPRDYLTVLENIVPQAMNEGGVQAEEVIGIGVDFTASSVLPTLADGTPLCTLSEYASEPFAWVKLWKDHAAQPEAEEMNELAEFRGEAFLSRYGGRLSSEWMFPKTLRMLNRAPDVYNSAERIIEAGDWLVWQLCGKEKRSACQAGYKGLWSKSDGYPSEDYLRNLNPQFAAFVTEKLSADIYPLGNPAGGLQEIWAQKMGLLAGTPVAIAMIDAHAAVLGSSVAEEGKMVLALGTSTCHLVMHRENIPARGIAGIVEDGIVPGLVAYESGQSAVGDIFSWFVKNQVPTRYEEDAKAKGLDLFAFLETLASDILPGSSGLLALDWWNGNRSTLMDASLSGMMVGLTLATRAEEIYRALIEATAFGTLAIIDNHTRQGIPVDELYACGGLAERSPLLLQIYVDVTGRTLKVSASSQAAALGAAIAGAVAASSEQGGYGTFAEATNVMARIKNRVYAPNSSANEIYQKLYAQYQHLYESFGRGTLKTMKQLRQIGSEASG